MIARFVLPGAPRTKKNHGKVIKRGERKFHVSSDAHKLWADTATWRMRNEWRRPPISEPVNVRALFFRDADRGDAVGYYQALADALQAAGVVEDDRLVVSWDGSRLYVDHANPRIELVLEVAV